jgi:hypothetical protein
MLLTLFILLYWIHQPTDALNKYSKIQIPRRRNM